jgi:hypothetical protein
VTDFYVEPSAEASFGDIFEASFLHDVFLQEDAVQLGARDLPARQGGGRAYAAAFPGARPFVLGRGGPHRSVLITDNCAVDTALGQGRVDPKPKGRLLFAPLIEAEGNELQTESFGRFPMPRLPDVLPAGIAELRRCFMVDSRAVAQHVDYRVASLGEVAAEALEIRWNAYSSRRGPLAAVRTAAKVAELLARKRGADEADQAERDLGRKLAELLTLAWRLEGEDVAQAADAYDAEAPGEAELAALVGRLQELATSASATAEALAARLS